jgi:hypothetical protein
MAKWIELQGICFKTVNRRGDLIEIIFPLPCADPCGDYNFSPHYILRLCIETTDVMHNHYSSVCVCVCVCVVVLFVLHSEQSSELES